MDSSAWNNNNNHSFTRHQHGRLGDRISQPGIRVSTNHPDGYQAPIALTQGGLFFHDVTMSYPVDRLGSSKYSLQGRTPRIRG